MLKKGMILLFCILFLLAPAVISTEPLVNDMIREYAHRTYYYDDVSFGVDDPDYTGPAPHKSAGESFEMNLFNVILTPKKWVDLEFNRFDDEYESIDELEEGESYVTRDGVKITVNHIEKGMFNFTLEKVSKDKHTILCPDCFKPEFMRETDGVFYVNLNQETWYMVDGKWYWVRIHKLDRSNAEAVMKVRGNVIPLLYPFQTFILTTGKGFRFLSSAYHDWGGRDSYGYAGFGFVDTHELPYSITCPNCSEFVYLKDGESQELRVNNKIYPLKMLVAGSTISLKYDGTTAELRKGEVAEINKDIKAVLLDVETRFGEPQYQIGIMTGEGSSIYCTEWDDKGADFAKKGKIEIYRGWEDSEFDREDFCIEDDLLVEYACVAIPGIKQDKDEHKGYTANMTYARCDCQKGKCKDTPSEIGDGLYKDEIFIPSLRGKGAAAKEINEGVPEVPSEKDIAVEEEPANETVNETQEQPPALEVPIVKEPAAEQPVTQPEEPERGFFGKISDFFMRIFG